MRGREAWAPAWEQGPWGGTGASLPTWFSCWKQPRSGAWPTCHLLHSLVLPQQGGVPPGAARDWLVPTSSLQPQRSSSSIPSAAVGPVPVLPARCCHSPGTAGPSLRLLAASLPCRRLLIQSEAGPAARQSTSHGMDGWKRQLFARNASGVGGGVLMEGGSSPELGLSPGLGPLPAGLPPRAVRRGLGLSPSAPQ